MSVSTVVDVIDRSVVCVCVKLDCFVGLLKYNCTVLGVIEV